MQPDDWPRIKEIFAAALALSPDARHAYLLSACGDDIALRRHVEDLLVSYDQADTFLETPADVIKVFSVTSLEGRRIGPYTLSSRIGAGGMGEVYKAHDTRLDRPVAIKVLPSHVASDALAHDRFEREARAVAALNHPHICTLHDVGNQDGIDFLVMEYLDGETLASRLEKGPLTLPQVLQYAVQIASALDRVHRAGIVHRDLKPGNIMLTKAGAKLLDFGLSKAGASLLGAHQASNAPTLEITSAGTILGTIPYMAPEQLDGQQADARSDIFAFGTVFYEMLSAKRAFGGDSHSAVIAAIREHEPQPLTGVSPAVDRIMRTCLAKDPDDRWQTARDLLRELKWIADDGPDTSSSVSVADSRASKTGAWRSTVMAVVIATTLAGTSYLFLQRPTPELLPARFEVSTPPTSDPMSFALSTDGRLLAFVAASGDVSKLSVRPIDQIAAQTFDGTDGASYPFWEPDGRSIAFFAEGKLKRLNIDSGLTQVITDAPTGRGGTWSRDGTIVFAPTTASTLMRVPANGGTPVPTTRLQSGENSHRWPQFLPDGRRFLFLSTQGVEGTQGIFIGALDEDEVTKLLDDDAPGVYATPDTLLVVRQSTLIAFTFDPVRGAIGGEPVPVAQPVGFDSLLARGAFAVSDTGVLAHRTGIAERRQLVWVDRTGTAQGAVGPADDHAMASPELNTVGRGIAIFRTLDGNADVWLLSTAGGVPSRFTFDLKVDGFPIWSSDGQRIMFSSNVKGHYGIFERPAVGVGDDRPLVHSTELNVPIPLDASADGRFLLFAVKGRTTGIDLWAHALTGDAERLPVAHSNFDEMAGQFSPDGRWIAYQSNASGRLEVYVTPFPRRGRQEQVSSAGGSQPRWAPDGRTLFYVAADRRMMSVPLDPAGQTLNPKSPVPLFATHLASGTNVPPAVGSRAQYDVAPDGRFLMNVAVEGAAAPPIAVALNWLSGLNR
jgi:serine/threonine protein kinase